MKTFVSILFIVLIAFVTASGQFRPPSVPLVTHDPYFSIWSPADHLNDRETVHWTGKNHPLHSIIRVDGISWRVMGGQPSWIQPLPQTGVKVFPTRTVYQFKNREIRLELTFTTPALVSDPEVLSRPVTYLRWTLKSADGKEHDVQIYFGCGADLAVNTPDQTVKWNSPAVTGLKTLRVGSVDQPVLERKGDDLRIDWGYVYLAVPESQHPGVLVATREKLMRNFVMNGKIPDSDILPQGSKVRDGWICSGSSWNLGRVGSSGTSSIAMIAFDDVSSIRYFGNVLNAFWKHDGTTMEQLLSKALDDFPKLSASCIEFDQNLGKGLRTAGGSEYEIMASLVYRHCLAAHKLVADANGKPLLFPKENFSNGCIATVDVIYPASPLFILFSPALTKALLQPVFAYAASSRWKFPFAPHDLGTYPHATGQVYGGGEKTEVNQMPVEETGNMIILTAALAKTEGNAGYAEANWPVLEKWSEYLLSKGFDPENQLCTDDFAGHLAHNVNLSAKAIVALGSYALLCEMTGRKEKAAEIRKKAESMAKEWILQANDGDHTRLAFDRPGTWSQKYNLVWDKILSLNLFPKEVTDREIQYYKTKQARYGLPLDSRERYTKNDWITWTATMADRKKEFRHLFSPVYHFADHTPQRVPVSDWYITDNAYMVGFRARPVVGGFFIKMLADKESWSEWVKKGTNVTGPWAPLKTD